MRIIGALFLMIALNVAAIHDTHADDVPDFNLMTPSGERIQLKSLLKEGPVLLDFWAMWCTPCLKAMPKLQALYEAHKEDGLTVLGINEDSLRGRAMVRPFLRARNLTFPVVFDASDGGVMWQMKVNALPTTILIDRSGKIVLQQCGYSAAKEKVLKRVLQSQHTLFEFQYQTDVGVKLQDSPFDIYDDTLRDPVNYKATQALGTAMREEGIKGFEYRSARDPDGGTNVALYDASPLTCNKPLNERSCLGQVGEEEVVFSVEREIARFTLEPFQVNGSLPIPFA